MGGNHIARPPERVPVGHEEVICARANCNSISRWAMRARSVPGATELGLGYVDGVPTVPGDSQHAPLRQHVASPPPDRDRRRDCRARLRSGRRRSRKHLVDRADDAASGALDPSRHVPPWQWVPSARSTLPLSLGTPPRRRRRRKAGKEVPGSDRAQHRLRRRRPGVAVSRGRRRCRCGIGFAHRRRSPVASPAPPRAQDRTSGAPCRGRPCRACDHSSQASQFRRPRCGWPALVRSRRRHTTAGSTTTSHGELASSRSSLVVNLACTTSASDHMDVGDRTALQNARTEAVGATQVVADVAVSARRPRHTAHADDHCGARIQREWSGESPVAL
jgi:hypothetical protein